MTVDEIEMRARVGDEWVPVTRASGFEWSDLRDPDEPDDAGETFADLDEKTWKMTVELAENEPVISLVRRLEREDRQRRMLARWWLRFPFASRVRCSAGVLL